MVTTGGKWNGYIGSDALFCGHYRRWRTSAGHYDIAAPFGHAALSWQQTGVCPPGNIMLAVTIAAIQGHAGAADFPAMKASPAVAIEGGHGSGRRLTSG